MGVLGSNMGVLGQDVRSALVAMRRAPGFTATALMTLALGIGATTAVFSMVYAVLLRPLPYAHADRLVRVWEEYPGGVSPAGNRWLSRSTYAVWREHTSTLDALGGYGIFEHHLGFDGERVKVFGARLSPAVLGTLGQAPSLGRFLTDDDDRDGAPPVVILSDGLWHERFGASPGVLGASLLIDDTRHTVVGVAPPAFAFPDPRVRFWVPYVIPRSATTPTGAAAFTALARLKPGVTLAEAEAEGTIAARAAPKHPRTEFFFGKGGPVVVHARALVDDMTTPVRPALSVLAVAVALVLLIACANVTSLMLSRGVTRQRELAIRAALGGSRARIARQLFTETTLFSIAGGVLGLVLACWLVHALPAIAPAKLPRLDAVHLDISVVIFWALATLVSTLTAGLAPAIRGARVDLIGALRSADRSSSDAGFHGVPARRLRDGLLVVEAAFAVILIVGATLLAKSFVRLMQVDNGYTANGVLIATVELPRETPEARRDQFIASALTRLQAMPGVSVAGAGAMIPLMAATAAEGFAVPESVSGRKPSHGRALVYVITPGYAEALGLRLREGRFFVESDAHAANLPTIVNQEFARQHLAVSQVTGLTIPHLVEHPNAAAEIVGVVGNVLKDGNDRQPQPELYFIHGSHGQRIAGQVNLVIRTTGNGNAVALARDVRNLVRQVDGSAVVERVEPLTTTLSASFDVPRFAASVMVGFASVAMILAAIGLYGVLSYSVSQRVRELGIRAALGARRVDLVQLVLREGLSVTFVGISLGIVGASLFTRLMQELLFGVTPLDAVAFMMAPAVLIVVSLGACLGPALRAASTDPAITLRS